MTHTIRSDIQVVQAFAPASCANVAVGFDMLGFAFDSIGDTITLTRRHDQQLIIQSITGHQSYMLPKHTEKNTATVVLNQLRQHLNINIGFDVQIHKGIPLSAGMGGSAASAVAALVAFNAFLVNPQPLLTLADYALFGEAAATGSRHADNILPCLYGGLVLCLQIDPIKMIQLPIPAVECVIVHPHFRLNTRKARAVLKPELPFKQHLQQSTYLAGFISAIYRNDLSLLAYSLKDVVVEPWRESLISGFLQVKQAALAQNALGAAISGAGPSVFALARDKNQAQNIGDAMQDAFKEKGITADVWIAPMSKQGARVIER